MIKTEMIQKERVLVICRISPQMKTYIMLWKRRNKRRCSGTWKNYLARRAKQQGQVRIRTDAVTITTFVK